MADDPVGEQRTRNGNEGLGSEGRLGPVRSVAGLRASLVQVVGVGGLLAIMIFAFSVSHARFFTLNNFQVIIASVSVIGIVSLGQTLVIIGGGFDLSVGGTIPLAGVVFALSVNAGYGVAISTAIAMAAGAAVGLANGLVICWLKINPLIATLATLSIAGGLSYSITSGQSVPFDQESYGVLGENSVGRIPYFSWIFLALVVIGIFVLRRTVYGRSLYALGGSFETSWLAGLRVLRLGVSTYVVTGALAGLGGCALASQLLAGDGSLGTSATLVSIAAVILGGASLSGGSGSIGGTLIGVFILGVLSNGLSLLHVSSFTQDIATGLVLLVAVGFSRLRATMARNTR